uniref:Iodothyronine deiodinase n=1 Tax=Oryzias sinensis TaxID=183150 RepID=A0A8C7Y2N1_9TELE
MGSAGAELLVTLQILPGFFSNCLFMALYDSVVLLKRVVSLLSCSRSVSCGEWRRMLTSAGLRAIWNSFLLDAYKQVTSSFFPPVAALMGDSGNGGAQTGDECSLLDFESSDRPLVVNFGSAT